MDFGTSTVLSPVAGIAVCELSKGDENGEVGSLARQRADFEEVEGAG